MNHSLMFRKFQIWCDCQKHGWDRSYKEVSVSIDATVGIVGHTVVQAGWQGRLGNSHQHQGNQRRAATSNRHKWGLKTDENVLELTDLIVDRTGERL